MAAQGIAVYHRECAIGNWKRLRKRWRTRKIIFYTVQNAKNSHPAGSENTAIPHFEIKLPKYRKKNCAIPQYHKPQCPPLSGCRFIGSNLELRSQKCVQMAMNTPDILKMITVRNIVRLLNSISKIS